MTNLDYIIETFDEYTNGNISSLSCYLCTKRLDITGFPSYDYCTTDNCINYAKKDNLMWLREPYKPKAKVTQFEYDLLKAFNETSPFRSVPALKLMHNKGYYSGVENLDDTVKHILDIAEVI